jgi:hypothetical protein
MSLQVTPSIFTPQAARAEGRPVAAPAVVADIRQAAESLRRDPLQNVPAPTKPASATFGARVSFEA